jgi:hypothetical protein
MSETTKQEGSFSLKGKKPSTEEKKEVVQTKEPVKVKVKPESILQEEVTKVVIKKEEENAIQEQTTDEAMLQDEQPEVGLQEVVEGNEESENATSEEEEVITIGETKPEAATATEEKYVEQKESVNLPENVEKLVDFMNETGGTMEDYIRLSRDYSSVDQNALLKEFYK